MDESEKGGHPEAYADLEQILEYIAADSLDSADRVVEEIFQAIRSLVPFPYVGHERQDLTKRSLRFQIVGSYLIAYAPDEKLSWSSLCFTVGEARA